MFPPKDTALPNIVNATMVKNPLVTAMVTPNINLKECTSYLLELTLRNKYPKSAPKGCEIPPNTALIETAFTFACFDVDMA